MRENKNILLLIFIILLGLFIRLFRFEDLAVFIADQAIDSAVVAQMVRGNFTLLGPKVSIGDFYNGPIVYYMMLPFYFVLNNNPIAGTVFQTILSVLTIPMVYLIGKRIHPLVGLMAAFFVAISSLLVDYSRAAFNAYPGVFFSSLAIYIMLVLTEKFSLQKSLLLGIVLGLIIQMHYLTISLILTSFLLPFIFPKTFTKKILYFVSLTLGFLVGFSPFIIFEFRHSFLNTHKILAYIINSENGKRTLDAFTYWPTLFAKLLFGNKILPSAFGLGFILLAIAKNILAKRPFPKPVTVTILLFCLTIATSFVFGKTLVDHYVLEGFIPLILIFSYSLWIFLEKNIKVLVTISLITLVLNFPLWNLSLSMHPLQDGINMKKATSIAKLIEEDCQICDYNLMMLAQKDNRAMPIRYFLDLSANPPQNVENYENIDVLYALIPQTIALDKISTWEYVAFGSQKIAKTWQFKPHFILYKFQKRTD